MSADEYGTYLLNLEDLSNLFSQLHNSSYAQFGPIYRDGAIMLDQLSSINDLPVGWEEKIAPGKYDLKKKGKKLFSHTIGPQSFKKFLHPPKRKLWDAELTGEGFEIKEEEKPTKMAFWGIRNCDLHAILILDRIFLKGRYVNKWYKKAREELFVVAVACSAPSSNCFCTTMGYRNQPETGFDFSLIELNDQQYLATAGSLKAHEFALNLGFQLANEEVINTGLKLISRAEKKLTKRFEKEEVAKTLKSKLEDKGWENIASKCLACANCTMVCPTCFCTTISDITDITGEHTERWQSWDSCFNTEYSYIHGGNIRNSTRSKYRQWMTHKFSNWQDQFATHGCVGCGRCITWCPVGIDITEELNAMKT